MIRQAIQTKLDWDGKLCGGVLASGDMCWVMVQS